MDRGVVQLADGGSAVIEEFCADCRLRDMTEGTIVCYRANLRSFHEFLVARNATFEGVSIQLLKGFLEHLKYEKAVKLKTIENVFSSLSAFYDYMVFEGHTNSNIILPFRKRYLRRYKEGQDDAVRRLLSLEEMGRLINSIMDPRDKAVAVVFAKTGIRRRELLGVDVDDVSWKDYSITLKPTPKRSNRLVFFDDETAIVLKRWLSVREKLNPKTRALFVSYQSLNRIDRNSVYEAMAGYAERLGFHNPASPKIEEHFGPHCFRHFFTTWLLRNGLSRDYVKQLRGDTRGETIDIYNHLDMQDVRKMYLACVPKFGL
jgi:integrase/recombinase XerD